MSQSPTSRASFPISPGPQNPFPMDRAHACLDAGIDPLDDAPIQAWLLDHPEHLEAFAAWRGVLANSPAGPVSAVGGAGVGCSAPTDRSRVLAKRVAAGVCVIVVASVVWLVMGRTAENPIAKTQQEQSTGATSDALPPPRRSFRSRCLRSESTIQVSGALPAGDLGEFSRSVRPGAFSRRAISVLRTQSSRDMPLQSQSLSTYEVLLP